MGKLRVGVVGFGYWGPNWVRNFVALDDSQVTCIADLAQDRLEKAGKLYPAVRRTQDAGELIASGDVDAVVIATPVASHYELAQAALRAGKHVLLEKPMTRTVAEAQLLIDLASERSVVLMVDHTFVYTGAVRKMRELIDRGMLGDLYYYDSARINLGLLQHDVNVVWDLATHDLSILAYLIDEPPIALRARAYRHVTSQQEEMATLTLEYASGFHADIRVNWLSPVKMRMVLVGGNKKMIVYDDVEPSEKLRVYDKGIVLDFGDEEVTTQIPIYRAGDVHIPKLDRTEALEVEARHFLDCIGGKCGPITGGAQGLEIVRLLEAADRSIQSDGRPIDLRRTTP